MRVASSGHLASNEQDSIDDVASCVAISLLTPPGWRDDEPDFGSRPDFPVLPVNLADLQSSVERDEPRARLEMHDDENTRQDLELRITTRMMLVRGES